MPLLNECCEYGCFFYSKMSKNCIHVHNTIHCIWYHWSKLQEQHSCRRLWVRLQQDTKVGHDLEQITQEQHSCHRGCVRLQQETQVGHDLEQIWNYTGATFMPSVMCTVATGYKSWPWFGANYTGATLMPSVTCVRLQQETQVGHDLEQITEEQHSCHRWCVRSEQETKSWPWFSFRTTKSINRQFLHTHVLNYVKTSHDQGLKSILSIDIGTRWEKYLPPQKKSSLVYYFLSWRIQSISVGWSLTVELKTVFVSHLFVCGFYRSQRLKAPFE